jgi:hypothetical protein
MANNAPTSSRPPLPEVPPVEYEGVRYAQDGLGSEAGGDQASGYLAAIDMRSGAHLWRLQVYELADPGAAGDCARHFRSMRLVPGRAELEIESETGSRYLVDLAGRTSTLLSSPAPASARPPGKAKPKQG